MIDRSILEEYKTRDAKRGDIAWKAYIGGDWTAENTARRLALGKDELEFDIKQSDAYKNASEEDRKAMLAKARGVTERNGRGGRTIFMQSAGDTNGAAWNDAIVLQHEAYRDGMKSWDQEDETLRAVEAHTKMAISLAGQGIEGFLSKTLIDDIIKYNEGDAAFAAYVSETYSSESDYWTLLKDVTLIRDGRADLYDEDGNLLARGVNTGDQISDEYESLKLYTGNDYARLDSPHNTATGFFRHIYQIRSEATDEMDQAVYYKDLYPGADAPEHAQREIREGEVWADGVASYMYLYEYHDLESARAAYLQAAGNYLAISSDRSAFKDGFAYITDALYDTGSYSDTAATSKAFEYLLDIIKNTKVSLSNGLPENTQTISERHGLLGLMLNTMGGIGLDISLWAHLATMPDSAFMLPTGDLS
jgi:hypothetical protein